MLRFFIFVFPPLAQACSLCPIHNSKFSSCALPPSLLGRGNGGEDSAGASLQPVPNPFKSTITSHTLANFQSLPKLIIINHFYSLAGASLQLVPNPKFKIQNSPHYCALPPSLLERGNGGED